MGCKGEREKARHWAVGAGGVGNAKGRSVYLSSCPGNPGSRCYGGWVLLVSVYVKGLSGDTPFTPLLRSCNVSLMCSVEKAGLDVTHSWLSWEHGPETLRQSVRVLPSACPGDLGTMPPPIPAGPPTPSAASVPVWSLPGPSVQVPGPQRQAATSLPQPLPRECLGSRTSLLPRGT